VLRPGALGSRIADVNAVAEHRAVDAHVAVAFTFEISADELVRGSFDHLRDLARGTEMSPLRVAFDAHEDGVSRGRIADGVFRNVDLGTDRAVDGVRPDEPEAGLILAKGPGYGAVRRDLPDSLVLADVDAALPAQVLEHPA